jgi:hypothetical protein
MSKYFNFFKKKCLNNFKIFSHMQEKKYFSRLYLAKTHFFFVTKLSKIGLKGVCETHP